MCYLPEFSHDVFLSYSHVDNHTVSKAEKGWVTHFYDLLKLHITKLVGQTGLVEIWWDDHLRPNQLFDDKIQSAISKSAVFMVFTSNGYYNSEYCRKELGWFYNSACESKFGLAVEGGSRIFNIQLYNIPHTEWPKECGGAGAYPMFSLDGDDKTRLGNPYDIDSPSFKKMISTMAEDIYGLLKQMKTKSRPAEAARPSPGPAGPKVFFARVPDTLASEKKQIVRELESKNIEVIKKAIPPPYERKAHATEVKKIIDDVCLSIHLFDHVPGDEIEEGAPTFAQEQLNIARSSLKQQLVFISKELDINRIEDEAHRKFLKDLQELKADNDKYNLIRESAPPNITREIMDKLNSIRSHLSVEPVGLAGSSSVFLDFHEEDNSYAIQMSNFLQQEGIRTYLSMNGASPRESINAFEAALKKARSLIIIRGKVAKDWVKERLNKAIETIMKEECDFAALGIYLAPQVTDHVIPIKQRFLQIQVLDDSQSAGFNPNTIMPFIKLIN